MLFRRHWVFSCAMLSGVSWATLHIPVQCCTKSITTLLNSEMWHVKYFHVKCFLKALGQHCTRFLPVKCCPNRQNWTGIFPVQCCLEPIGQHCTRFLPVQCCTKSIKTILNLCNVALSQLDNIAQGFYLCNVGSRVLRRHWTGFFPVQYCLEPLGQHCRKFLIVQCCPKSIKTPLNMIFSSAMLSGASWTTLHKIFNCAMLS